MPRTGEHYQFYPEGLWIEVQRDVNKYPRRIFDSSPIWKAVFESLPQSKDQPEEGSSERHPLSLSEGTATLAGFVNFARVEEARIQQNGFPSLSAEEWIQVLRLADMWEMHSLRARIVAQLSELFADPEANAALQLRAGIDYDIAAWKLAGMDSLITRPAVLTAPDLETIGFTHAAFVIRERERRNITAWDERHAVKYPCKQVKTCLGAAADKQCYNCQEREMIRRGHRAKMSAGYARDVHALLGIPNEDLRDGPPLAIQRCVTPDSPIPTPLMDW